MGLPSAAGGGEEGCAASQGRDRRLGPRLDSDEPSRRISLVAHRIENQARGAEISTMLSFSPEMPDLSETFYSPVKTRAASTMPSTAMPSQTMIIT
ncbi:MAG: hypothetical protein MUQ10_14625, partial [Anaerolineae bacterium]|nr:hypothetical protein [Anaerolineae bacterium]